MRRFRDGAEHAAENWARQDLPSNVCHGGGAGTDNIKRIRTAMRIHQK